MGRKIHPRLYRLGTVTDWNSHWFAPKGSFGPYLQVDAQIRDTFSRLFSKGVVDRVLIERSPSSLKITVLTPRPGLVVGRQGGQIREIEKKIAKIVSTRGKPPKVSIDIQEIKEPELHANLIAQEVAAQLEKRTHYRRVLKQTLLRLTRQKSIKGVKIKVKGRLDGAEIARAEWVASGKVPLAALRSDIDYGFAQAVTKWGVVGVKVWIYKGEKFSQSEGETSF